MDDEPNPPDDEPIPFEGSGLVRGMLVTVAVACGIVVLGACLVLGACGLMR